MNHLKIVAIILLIISAPVFAHATFNPATNYTAGISPRALVKGDFNNDTKLDIVVANSGSNNFSLLTGNGDGTFNPSISFNIGASPRDIVAGDFNNDGKLDIITSTGAVTAGIKVFLGTGTGSFGAPSSFTVPGLGAGLMATADFNGDSFLDLVIEVGNGSLNNIAVLLGTGNGSFSAGTLFSSASDPFSVTTGDFNNDGNVDFATASLNSQNIGVFLGIGNGTFNAPNYVNVGVNPYFINAGDFNNDTVIDLIIGYKGLNESFKVLTGQGNGLFNATPNTYNVTTRTVIADFNGDNRLNAFDSPTTIDLATTTSPHKIVGKTGNNIVTADFNGDQALDVAVIELNNIAVYIYDTVPPTGSISINNNDPYTNLATVNLALSCNDGIGSGCATMQFSTDNMNWGSKTAFYTGARVNLPFATDGIKTVYVRFYDKSGNISSTTSDSIFYDSTPPNAPVISSPSVNAYSNIHSMTHDIAGITEPGSTVSIYYQYTPSTPIGTVIAAADGTWSLATIGKPLREGINRFFVTATDKAKNVSSQSKRDYIVDTIPPVFDQAYNSQYVFNTTKTLTSPPTGFNTRTASDLYPVTVTTDAPNVYPIGSTTVTWVATDIHGNSQTSSTVVVMNDITPPPVPDAPVNDTGSGGGSGGCLTAPSNRLALFFFAMLLFAAATKLRKQG